MWQLVGRVARSTLAASAARAAWLAPAPTMALRAAAARFYSSDLPDHMIVNFPALSPTMKTGTLQQWNVSVGDEVATGDSLGEVETDKATMSFDSTEDGFVAKLFVEDGTEGIEIGQPVLVLVDNKEDVPAFENFEPPAFEGGAAAGAAEEKKEEPAKAPEPTPAPSKPSSTPAPETSAPAPSSKSSGERVFASPLARKLAERASIALENVVGTGPRGRITKADVDAYQAAAPAESTAATAATGAAYTDIPLSNVRKVIASRLTESKQNIPHYYLNVDVCVDEVLNLRKQLNDQGNGDYKLSVNDFVIKASSLALKEVKEVNSSWMDTVIRQNETVDISVAVSTDSGLITPIVFDADLKGLREISTDVKNLAAKARDNALKPEEYQGGTFTISNLGMFGIDRFTAIINPPQSCILAVGQTAQRVVVDPTAESGFAAANYMSVTLSCDHRVVDGAVGSKWLAAFRRYMEDPVKMLL